MFLIINTVLSPFSITIFDEQGSEISSAEWTEGKLGGRICWEFSRENLDKFSQFKFIAGLDGPGGLSNLRLASTFLNTTNLIHKIPILKSSMMKWVELWQEQKNFPGKFLLNSFGQRVWEISADFQTLKSLEINDFLPTEKYSTAFLPPEKTKIITEQNPTINFQNNSIDMKFGRKILAQYFQQKFTDKNFSQENSTIFLPNYHMEAVQ